MTTTRSAFTIRCAAAIALSFCLSLSYGALAQTDPTAKNIEQIRSRLLSDWQDKPTQTDVQTIETALERQPKDGLAHLTIALCYDRLGLNEQAQGEYRLAVQCTNDPRALESAIKSEFEGESDAAPALLEAAYQKFPQDAPIMVLYAKYLSSIDRKKEAEALLKTARDKDDQIEGLSAALAQLELERHNYTEAIRLADQDLVKDPQSRLANRVKGLAERGLGYYDQALAPLKKAYAHTPFDAEIASNYAQACLWTGNFKRALDPTLVTLAINSTTLLPDDQSDKLVMRVIPTVNPIFLVKRINALTPNINRTLHSCMYHFHLGEILDQLQMPDLAISQYQEGLLMSPNNAHGLLLLGLDLEIHKRQYKEALDCYARAHQMAPSDQNIKAHMTRLDKRLAGRSSDIAWQLRDWLASLCQHSESEENKP